MQHYHLTPLTKDRPAVVISHVVHNQYMLVRSLGSRNMRHHHHLWWYKCATLGAVAIGFGPSPVAMIAVCHTLSKVPRKLFLIARRSLYAE